MDENQPNNFGPGPMGPAPIGPEPINDQPTPPPVPPVSPVPPAPNPVVPPAPTPMGPDFQPPKPDTGLNKGLIIGLIVAGAVVLAGIGFATGFAIGRSSVKPTNNCPTTDSTTSQSTTSANTNVSTTLNGVWKMTDASLMQVQQMYQGLTDSQSDQSNTSTKIRPVTIIQDNTVRFCADETLNDCDTSNLTISQGQAALDAVQKTEQEVRNIVSQANTQNPMFALNDVYYLNQTSEQSSEGMNASIKVGSLWVIYTTDTGEVGALNQSLLPMTYTKVSD